MLGSLSALVGCGGAWEVERSNSIDAKPEVVWQVLADLERYPEWNSYSPKVTGTLAVGETVVVEAHLGDEVRKVDNVVTRVEPPSRLCWQSRDWYGFLVRGTRCRMVSAGDGGGTRFRHHEIMEGLAAGLIEQLYRSRVEAGLEQMNLDLKRRAEALQRNGS